MTKAWPNVERPAAVQELLDPQLWASGEDDSRLVLEIGSAYWPSVALKARRRGRHEWRVERWRHEGTEEILVHGTAESIEEGRAEAISAMLDRMTLSEHIDLADAVVELDECAPADLAARMSTPSPTLPGFWEWDVCGHRLVLPVTMDRLVYAVDRRWTIFDPASGAVRSAEAASWRAAEAVALGAYLAEMPLLSRLELLHQVKLGAEYPLGDFHRLARSAAAYWGLIEAGPGMRKVFRPPVELSLEAQAEVISDVLRVRWLVLQRSNLPFREVIEGGTAREGVWVERAALAALLRRLPGPERKAFEDCLWTTPRGGNDT